MKELKKLAQMFKALSDKNRLLMLYLLLYRRELCVCDFVYVLKITQSKASRHLRYLANAGIVEDRRIGNSVFYRIVENPSDDLLLVLSVLMRLFPENSFPNLMENLGRWMAERRNIPRERCETSVSEGDRT